MQKRSIFILLAALVATGAFAEAYKWTDENGIVHYSDRPHPGATIVVLDASGVRRPRPTTQSSPFDSTNDAADTEPKPAYESLEVTTPTAGQTLWNIGGTLRVSVVLTPALKSGHRVRAYFDGTPHMVGGTNFQIPEVYRGVHSLQVEVIDKSGKLVIRSRPSRFYVQQSTVR